MRKVGEDLGLVGWQAVNWCASCHLSLIGRTCGWALISAAVVNMRKKRRGVGISWVLEPGGPLRASGSKKSQTRDLVLGEGSASGSAEENVMSAGTEVQTAICGEYERLLQQSHQAAKTWNEQRRAIYDSGARGREADLELLRLQAKYAGAYARLQKHVRECERCRFVSSLAKVAASHDRGSDRATDVGVHL
jgi:hypothetical protein